MKLSAEAALILRALAAGDSLKVHRYLDGTKVYRLHGLDGMTSRDVTARCVQALDAARACG